MPDKPRSMGSLEKSWKILGSGRWKRKGVAACQVGSCRRHHALSSSAPVGLGDLSTSESAKEEKIGGQWTPTRLDARSVAFTSSQSTLSAQNNAHLALFSGLRRKATIKRNLFAFNRGNQNP